MIQLLINMNPVSWHPLSIAPETASAIPSTPPTRMSSLMPVNLADPNGNPQVFLVMMIASYDIGLAEGIQQRAALNT
jgi:hypothetical protein